MSSTIGKTIAHENYPTPVNAVDALMKLVNFRATDRFLEPCKGDGAIYDRVPLPESQKYWAEIRQDVDYLTTQFKNMDVIITNPPFSKTIEFLNKSESELAVGGTLIYLQRINFLGSKTRVPFWEKFGHPHKLSILVPRTRFFNKRCDSCEYAWFMWDFGHRLSHLPNISSSLAK